MPPICAYKETLVAKITLVLGGIRSGKSVFAENFVLASNKEPVYLATAEIFDDEMRNRVQKHRSRRDVRWTNIEQSIDILSILERFHNSDKIVLVDCLAQWLGNLMHHQHDVGNAITSLVAGLETIDCEVVFVANEVGLSIIPENKMAREFADYSGQLNQAIAAIASDVYFVAAGLPLKLKGRV